MPNTQEGQSFDESGICNVCRSSEEKMRIDWAERRGSLTEILEAAKLRNADNEYDCLIPISGGKDSTFQLHVLVKEFGMRPLAATFSHNWFTSAGMYNLFNALEKFDIDHVMFTPKRSLVNRLAKKSLSKIGDSCWHCHAGVGAYPLRVAKDYGIDLVIWGESVAESSSRGTYKDPIMKFDQDYFHKVSAKIDPIDFVDEDVSMQELKKFESLSSDEYSRLEIIGIHLGDFLFWDEERQTEFVKEEYGWREDVIEGTYKGYKSTECIMPGVHDFACYLKRGYGRTSFHTSADIRAGLMSREDVDMEIINKERQVPATLSYFTEITGIELETFIESIEGHKPNALKGKALPIIPVDANRSRKKIFLEDLRVWLEEQDDS
jgi:N-acetyl sugar amidotransferase